MLHEWNGHQVVYACYNKQMPMTYHDYMKNQIKSKALAFPIEHKGHTHTRNWLENCSQYFRGDIGEDEVKPHHLFFKRVIEKPLEKARL
jgi:hypothetical protein